MEPFLLVAFGTNIKDNTLENICMGIKYILNCQNSVLLKYACNTIVDFKMILIEHGTPDSISCGTLMRFVSLKVRSVRITVTCCGGYGYCLIAEEP